MAIPTTGKQALATATNPSGVLTDPTLFVLLSNLDSEWWGDSNTSDGPRGRACKLDGTELPCDWIEFNNTAYTGFLKVKWLGDLETTGSQQVYVFPPNTRNTAYAESDTYGRHNAYTSDNEYTFDEASGSIINRASSSNDASVSGSPDYGVTGQVGDAVDFSADNSSVATADSKSGLTSFTLMMWAYLNVSSVADRGFASIGEYTGDSGTCLRYDAVGFSGGQPNVFKTGLTLSDSSSASYESAANSAQAQTYQHICYTWASGESPKLYVNGSLSPWSYDGGVLTGTLATGDLRFGKGRTTQSVAGRIDEGKFWGDSVLSAAHIAYEYAQTNDNATFWGTWITSDVSGGVVSPYYYTFLQGGE